MEQPRIAKKSIKNILVWSGTVAIIACSGPFLLKDEAYFGYALYASILLTGLWACLLLVGVIRHKAKGLWILCELPLAAFWLIWYFLLAWGQRQKG